VEVVEAGQIFLDLSRLPDSSTVMPSLLKEIVLTTDLQPALGWGVNRWIAKMAARQASTRQLPASTIVPPGHEAAFLKPLPIRWAEEIPEEVCRRLEQLGIHTWGQVSSVPAHYLLAQAGLEAGNRLLRLAQGEDPRPLGQDLPSLDRGQPDRTMHLRNLAGGYGTRPLPGCPARSRRLGGKQTGPDPDRT